MNSIFRFSLYMVLCLLFLGCVTSERKIEVVNPDILNDVNDDLAHFIAHKYYNSNKKPIIRVYLDNFQTALDNEPILTKYCHNEIRNYLDKKSQIEVVTVDDPNIDCIIDVYVLENTDNDLTILSNVREPRDDIILYSKQHRCKVRDLISDTYLSYKRYYLEEEAKDANTAYLTVKAINIGDAIKNPDELILYNRYFSGGAESYLIKEERGYTGLYPGEQKCIINGKECSMPYDTRLFYDGKISPGTVNLLASCKVFFWDDQRQRQSLLDVMEKQFRVVIGKNDNIRVEIYFVTKHNEQKISAVVYRKRVIEEQSKIDEKHEVIQIFSD